MQLFIKDKLLKVDEMTDAGHIYPRAVIEKELHRLMIPNTSGVHFFATLECPVTPVELTLVAGVVSKLELRDKWNYVMAEILITSTDTGKKFLREVADGVRFKLNPIGFGSTDENGVVGDDYRMTHIDLHRFE